MKVLGYDFKVKPLYGEAELTFRTKNLAILASFFSKRDNSPLEVEIRRKSKKRSLDANAYYWVLVGKIAEVLKQSNTEMHNILLGQYGTPLTKGDQVVMTLLPDDIPYLEDETMHLKPTGDTRVIRGRLHRWWIIMKGSSAYSTVEMSRLIDGAVEEAKALDIEVLTPDEIEHMKASWK